MRGNKSFQKRIGSSVLVAGMVAAMIGASLAGCSVGHKSPLDPNHPVSLTVWHYYHGAQQNAFDALVEKFNSTVGKEEGIYVQGISQGSVSDLESAVSDSLEGKVGAADMPDIFSSYADTAYEVEQKGALANLSDYLTDEELLAYVDSYVEEGRIAEDNSLRIFPVAKSTEIMMLNKTDWDTFAAATGVTLDELATIEGVVEVSQKYYEWTDSLTPDVPEDGKAFYGRDAMANYFCIGMKQLGNEIFQVDGGEVTLNVDQDSIRRLWDGYYVPMVKGYFCAYGTFRSDDMKTGDLLAYTGSTASATYFPDEVENDEERYAIDYLILQAPKFQGGENYAVQQGAGMVVSKSDEQHEYAAVEFLKWFTQVENNYMFCEDSGYLPVRKDASSTKVLDRMIQEEKIAVSDKSYDCLTLVFDEMQDVTMYTNKSFRNGEKARQVLEYRMSDQALADRAEVENRLSQGMTLEEAAAPYLTETYFEQWYQSFCEALQEAVNQS
jgi:multiple sugar transport system substrate-binding protein